MATEALADLLACVAAFGRSLDDSFDPARFLAEFSARARKDRERQAEPDL